ncbi:MAG: DUF362 domain-containing protein [Verrucomicrobia bacterium]|nr:DUF362 domain-containing protein [Verrucomicrobiota bacterium]
MSASVASSARTRCFTQAAVRLKPLVLQELKAWAGSLRPRRIVVKPNWVQHETDPAFPIRALVTDPRVIEATVESCLEIFPDAESILVGDCPLQSADWPRLCAQSGLSAVMERLSRRGGGRVSFRDLRKDVFCQQAGSFLVASETEHGDPRGYREVELGARSHLEPISNQSDRFAVNDYSAAVTRSNHAPGSHRYFVSQSVLDADLLINLPKWKAHAKSGLTCALKNLVGINGDKAYLPHFRRGAPRWGGDEYRDEGRWLYWAQTTLRETVQKRSRFAYQVLKPGWELIKRMRGIETRMSHAQAQPKNFYIAGGAWHGNQTIWRMIYDLNLVIQCADAAGRLQEGPARQYFCIVDGLVSGEGNGPLQPLPRETDWLAFGEDPFAIDAALCWFMGFDPNKVPILAQRAGYAGPAWGDFELSNLAVEVDGQPTRLMESPVNFHFVPPPGWRNQIER